LEVFIFSRRLSQIISQIFAELKSAKSAGHFCVNLRETNYKIGYNLSNSEEKSIIYLLTMVINNGVSNSNTTS